MHINQLVFDFRKAIEVVRDNGGFDNNFFEDLDLSNKIFSKQKRKSEDNVFSDKELFDIQNVLESNIKITGLGVLLAIYTGMRVGEIVALKWEDVYDDYIHINRHQIMFKNDDGKRVYKIVDDHLTWLYDNVCDENTIICICADHGAIATIDDYYPMEILKNAGLTTYIDYDFEKVNWRNEGIDWSKTKAYCVGCCHINVNLKGREPCGIVEPEDYDKVVKEIIVALHEHGTTHSGTHKGEFAFVVPGDQAGFVGLGGECVGDVVYGIMGGEVGGYFGDVHAVQIPSAKNKFSDERPVCIMSGKGLKKDFLLKRPTDLTDIAPTVLYAAGYSQTKDATGGIVFAALEDN